MSASPEQKSRNLRTALILGAVAAAFFMAMVIKTVYLSH